MYWVHGLPVPPGVDVQVGQNQSVIRSIFRWPNKMKCFNQIFFVYSQIFFMATHHSTIGLNLVVSAVTLMPGKVLTVLIKTHD